MNYKILAVALGCAVTSATLNALTFTPFSTPGGAPIGFAFAGDKFVGSRYFDNQLYQTNLSGGGVTNFGTPLPIASSSIGEIYVTSSLGLGGFGMRDVFAGSEAAGTVYRFSNSGGAPTVFASGLSGDVRGIAFDPFGTYGNDMIVTTQTGNVYRVNSAGTPTLLANVGGDAEGLDFAPNAFGNFAAGTLFVLSEGTGRINAIAPDGSKTDLGLQFNTPEMLSFVPLNLGASGSSLEGFYAANYAVNVVKADASQFSPYVGQAILTEEGTHNVYRIFAGPGNVLQKELIGNFPNQPEDGVFVTVAILNPGGTAAPEHASWMTIVFSIGMIAWMRRRLGSR